MAYSKVKLKISGRPNYSHLQSGPQLVFFLGPKNFHPSQITAAAKMTHTRISCIIREYGYKTTPRLTGVLHVG